MRFVLQQQKHCWTIALLSAHYPIYRLIFSSYGTRNWILCGRHKSRETLCHHHPLQMQKRFLQKNQVVPSHSPCFLQYHPNNYHHCRFLRFSVTIILLIMIIINSNVISLFPIPPVSWIRYYSLVVNSVTSVWIFRTIYLLFTELGAGKKAYFVTSTRPKPKPPKIFPKQNSPKDNAFSL